MTTYLRHTLGLGLLLLAGAAQAAPVSIDLYATSGSNTVLPDGTSRPVLGYATVAATPVTAPGGPVIAVNQGDVVTVTLYNNLSEPTALLFQGQAMAPDTVGAAAGLSQLYTFTAANPGTFLYEAGLLPNAQGQVARGLHGALIVRPATAGQAYDSAATAYDDEAVLVLSELDPALNASPTPAAFDMRDYAPKYFLINGKAYPATDPIASAAGRKVLLRYVNAGIRHHSMTSLGLRQKVVAKDGSSFTYAGQRVAETIAPGQTMDAIVTVPAGALEGSKFALFDGTLNLFNNRAAGFGGMLTFINASAAGGGTGTGPATSLVAVTPTPTNGSLPVAVTATVTADVTLDPLNLVIAAEFYIDVPGAAGAGTPMLATDLAFDTSVEAVNGTIMAATLAAMPAGTHTVYVHGQDSALAWGPFATATLTLDKAGPTTGPVTLVLNPSNGSADVAIASTITDAIGTVAAAEYFIDTQGSGGAGAAMLATDLAFDGASEAVSGAILVATLAALPAGNHTIYVHGRNSAGNWGTFNFAVLNLDKVGPTTTSLALAPNPSNGTVDVALSGTGDDRASGSSNIAAAEYQIDAGPALPLTVTPSSAPGPGAPVASLTASVPAATVSALAPGTHVVSVRSQDALGNWGAVATANLLVDTTGPVTTSVVAAPSPTNGAIPLNASTLAVRVTAIMTDSATAIAAGEGFIDTVGANGTGFVFIPSDGLFNLLTETGYADIPLPTINALPVGNHTILVRGKDAAGNWGASGSTILLIDKAAPSFTSLTLSPTTAIIGEVVALTANGATDPLVGGLASGVSGGQYWIDGTATPPAGATAFTGTSTTFSALTGGVHTVYARVRDAAGNWSTVRSATLTVPSALNDALAITANNNATQTSDVAAPGLLANDLPVGAAGRTATLASLPARISGTGAGTITVTCPASLGTAATPAILGNTVCTNGAYRATLNGVGATGPSRAASKRGTYQFTYTETLNGKTTVPATVTITVN